MTSNYKRLAKYLIAIAVLLALVYIILPKPPIVDVAEVIRGDLNAALSTTGIVESDLSDVSPRIVARVARLLVQENDIVAAGQPLALLERSDLAAQVDEAKAAAAAARGDLARAQESIGITSSQSAASIAHATAGLHAAEAQLTDLEKGARPQEIEQARAAVTQAQAEAERARSDQKRAETLFKKGAIPAQQLDAARTATEVAGARARTAQEQLSLLRQGPRTDAVRAARAQVAAARAALAEAESSAGTVGIRRREAAIAQAQVSRAQAALQTAGAQLDYAVVRSPYAGVVARKHLEVGEMAGPQQPVISLADLSNAWIIAEVDEEDVGAVAMGQRIKVTTDAYPGTEAYGKVVRISPIAEPKAIGRVRAKMVRAKILVDPSRLPLKPGMEVDINGSVPVGRNLVLVPNDAVVQVGDRYQVLVVKDGHVMPRYVTVGLSNYDYTAVVRGLHPGEVVAINMLDQLKPGQGIRPRSAARNAR